MPTPGQQRKSEYSIEEAARSLGYTYRHTRRLIAEGKLDATCKRIGEARNRVRWQIDKNALRRFKRHRAQRLAFKWRSRSFAIASACSLLSALARLTQMSQA